MSEKEKKMIALKEKQVYNVCEAQETREIYDVHQKGEGV